MVGHRAKALNAAVWREGKGVAREEGVLHAPGGVQGKYKALKGERRSVLERAAQAGEVPDFWGEYLPAVVIEADDEEGGPVGFKPYGFQEEFFRAVLEGRRNVLWVKERQIGASWCLAALAYYVAAYHLSAHVGIISMGQREANELMRKVRYIASHLPLELYRETTGWSEMEFIHSKSVLKAFPSKESTGVSFRFRLLLVDEAARHPYGQENYNEYRPSIARGGQLVVCSTSDPSLGRSGFFYRLVERTCGAAEGWNGVYERTVQRIEGGNGFLLLFNGKYSRPEHDDEFYARERREYEGSDAEFDSHYPLTIADAFTGASGLVYGQFDPGRHVRVDDPMEWGDYAYRLAGFDPGGGDPTAVVVVGVYQDVKSGVLRFHQPAGGEFVKKGAVSIDEVVEWLMQWEARAPLTRVYDGTSGGQTNLAALKRYWGDRAWPANRDREGIGVIAGLLDTQCLTIHESNVVSVKEFYGYRWLDRVDPNDKGRYKTATPVDNHADAMDGRRFAIVSFKKKLDTAVAGGYLTPRDRFVAGPNERESHHVRLKWN